MGKQRKSVIYVRVGSMSVSARQEELAIQEVECRRYAAEAGYDVADVFTDFGTSGRSRSREGLDRMLAFLRETNDPDLVVIVSDPSRLARDIGLTVETLSTIHEAGATLEMVSGPI